MVCNTGVVGSMRYALRSGWKAKQRSPLGQRLFTVYFSNVMLCSQSLIVNKGAVKRRRSNKQTYSWGRKVLYIFLPWCLECKSMCATAHAKFGQRSAITLEDIEKLKVKFSFWRVVKKCGNTTMFLKCWKKYKTNTENLVLGTRRFLLKSASMASISKSGIST